MEKTLDDEETCQHRVVNSRWHSQHYRRLETLQACYRETTQNEELSPRTGRQCDKLHSLIENGDNRIRIKRKRMSKKKQASSAYEKANGLLSACLKQVQMLKAECRPYYPCCTVLDEWVMGGVYLWNVTIYEIISNYYTVPSKYAVAKLSTSTHRWPTTCTSWAAARRSVRRLDAAVMTFGCDPSFCVILRLL